MKRFWQVDTVRGIAIIMVVVFHLFFDLDYLGILQSSMYSGGWLVFQRIAASLFLALVGISLILRYQKISKKDHANIWKTYFLGGSKILFWGLVITLATFIFAREQFVIFGILHLIGVSIILAPLFLRFYYLNLVLGILSLLIGNFIGNMVSSFKPLLLVGIPFEGFSSLDYFPLFPWFGIVLIGIFIGKFIYPYLKETKIENSSLVKGLTFLGRNTLPIYLIHQPLLLGVLYLIF